MKPVKSLLAGLALSVALGTQVFAAAGIDLNVTPTGLALQGYDPVAYFTEGAPTPGNWKITATHNGATYRFATKEHKAAFEANPTAYLPQYGGYCAFGAAMGFKFDGDPQQWKIVDGELYLNLSKEVQARWLKDVPGFIDLADNNWTTIASKHPDELQ